MLSADFCMSLTEEDIANLQKKVTLVRRDIITILSEAGSGHTAGSLGIVEVFVALYSRILKIDPNNPTWEERDRLVLSHGHVCPAMYSAMSQAGFFPHEELITLRKLGSRLQGHPHRESLPGLETTSGPLGSGLSQASGMALAGKMDKKSWRVVCLTSDGEHNEGNIWEAVMLAGKYKLDNLVSLIDRNYIQIDGFTEDVMPLDSLKGKYESFGWHALEIDGHDFNQIIEAFEKAKTVVGKPTVVIARTVPGKGVSFMENKPEWHGKSPKEGEAEKALEELNS